MSIETRVRATGQQPGGGGGGSSNSAGLAGTGAYYALASANTTLPNSYVLQPGANTSFAFSGSNFTISSNTGGAANSAGLLGTGGYFIVGSVQTLMPNSKVLTAGSSITTATDSTAFYISATTANALAYVLTSRNISTTSPVGGGGTLANDLTLTVGSLASIGSANQFIRVNTDGSTWGYINFNQGSSTILTQGSGFIRIDATTANALAFVLSSRAINTSYPLAGGGDLSTDRTHTVDTAFLVTSNRTISTTSPLGGGGNLGANLTFTAGSLSTIGSANQFIRVNTDGASWGYINMVGGSSVTLTQKSGILQIDASTGGAASNSAGLAGTGFFYVFHTSSTTLYPNSRLLTAGSSITITTDSTSVYITALTGGAGGSGTINTGSATYLAFYPVSGTTLDDATLSVTTGSGIASFNVPLLTSDPGSPASGDVWMTTSSGKLYLKASSNSTTFSVQLA